MSGGDEESWNFGGRGGKGKDGKLHYILSYYTYILSFEQFSDCIFNSSANTNIIYLIIMSII